MDPEIAWKDLRDAYRERNLDDMESSAGDLLDWLAGGGFPPRLGEPMDAKWDRMMVEAACRFVLEEAARIRSCRKEHP